MKNSKFNLGYRQMQIGLYKEAIVQFDDVIKNEKKNKEAYINRGQCYAEIGQYKKSLDDFSAVLEIDHNNEKAFFNRGLVYMMTKDFKKAIGDYNKLISINDKNENYFYNRGLLHYDTGEYNKAIEDMKRTMLLDPHFANAYNTLIAAQEKIYEKSNTRFHMRSELFIKDISNRIRSFVSLEENIKTLEKIEETIKNEKRNPISYYNKGVILLNLYRYEEAVVAFDNTIEFVIEIRDVDRKNELLKMSYNGRGKAKFFLEKYVDAIEEYDKAISVDGLFGEAYSNRGVSQIKLKLYSEAEISLKKAITLDNKVAMINIYFLFHENKRSEELLIVAGDLYENAPEYFYLIISSFGNILLEILQQNGEVKYIDDILKYGCLYSLDVFEKISQLKNINLPLYEKIKHKINELFRIDFNEMSKICNITDNTKIEKTLYMYRNINESTINNLVNDGIYKSDPNFFNDPFDPFYKVLSSNVLEEHLSQIKISCFSSKSDNLLLWAHYGGNHKGICVGYRFIGEENNERTLLGKVEYETIDVRLRENAILLNDNSKDINLYDLFFRKHGAWSYEEEYRIIHLHDEKNNDIYYKNMEICEIYFGVKCTEENKKLIKLILKDKNIMYYNMKMSDNLELDFMKDI